MFNTFDVMAINHCCILGGPYYPTLPIHFFDLSNAETRGQVAPPTLGGPVQDTAPSVWDPPSGVSEKLDVTDVTMGTEESVLVSREERRAAPLSCMGNRGKGTIISKIKITNMYTYFPFFPQTI